MRTRDAIVELERLRDAEMVIDECDHAMRSNKGDSRLRIRCGDGEIAVRAADLRALALDAALVIIADLENAGYKVPGGRARR